MKSYIAPIIWIFGLIVLIINQPDNKAKRLELAENSYATGCYNFAMHYCSDESDGDECRQDALDFCPEQAKKFSDWIGRK